MGWVLLLAGLALWIGAHVFKRVAPQRRAAFGDSFKGVVAVAIVGSIVLMVLGYGRADGAVFWGRNAALTGINNLLMIFAVYLYAASGMKTAITRRIRHPQLTAVKVWALAHILVNGDVPSFVLFGGLLGWAVWEVILINRQTERVQPTGPVETRKEIMAIVGTVIVYGGIAWVHGWLGYPVFG